MSSPRPPAENETGSRSSIPGSSRFPYPFHTRIRVVAVALIAALVLLRITLPFALEWAIPQIAAGQNLVAKIGNVDLGLIAGEITLEDLVIDFPPRGAADPAAPEPVQMHGSQPLLSLDRIFIAFEWTDLLFRRIHITDFDLQHPILEISQLADGSLELPMAASEDANQPTVPIDDAIENASVDPSGIEPTDQTDPAPDTEAQPTADPGWEFMLDRFALNDPDLTLRLETTQEEVVHLAAERLGFDALFIGPEGIELGGIDLEHPELFVQRRWLLGLGGAPSNPELESEALEAPPAGIPSVHMKHLKIERAAFTVRTQEGPVEVTLRLELTDAGTKPGETFPIDLGVQIGDAAIGVAGQLGLNPPAYSGRLTWQNLSVPPFLLLAYPKLVPWLASGEAYGDIKIDFHSVSDDVSGKGPPGLTASGSTGVSSLSFKHPETGELALEWKSLDLDIREAFVPLEPTPELPIRIDLSRVALASPRIVYTNPPDALDELLAALADGSAPTEDASIQQLDEAPSESASVPRIEIDRLELTDGTLRYVDRSVKPAHETKVHKLHARIDALTTLPTIGASQISIDGLIQSAGSFDLRGALPNGQGELDFSLRQLDLVSYDSLARAAGWQIESGAVSIETTVIARDNVYKTKNELVLHDLDVAAEAGNGFSSQFGMPVDLVLALLRDPEGDISISAPIVFDSEGTNVELGTILASTLRNALQGAIASPIKMFGMLIPKGASTDSFGALPFAPGEAQPGPDARSQLESLAEFVQSRPMLKLSLHGHWSADDRTPTARKILAEKALSGADLPELDGVSFFARRRIQAALRARGSDAEETLSPEDDALLARVVAAQEVSETRFRALAEARAESLRTMLLDFGAPAEALAIGSADASESPSVSIELDSRRPSITAKANPDNPTP